MSSTSVKPAAPTIAEAKLMLRRNSDTKRDRLPRMAEGRRRMLAIVGGKDLATLAKEDPDKARKAAGEIAMAQSELAVEELIVSGLDDQVRELGPMIIDDSGRLLGRIQRLAEANVLKVRMQVMALLRELKLYEEERLPRLANEAVALRAECGLLNGYQALGCGGVDARNDGKGGVYYERLDANQICTAHDNALAALAKVEARAAELAAKLK